MAVSNEDLAVFIQELVENRPTELFRRLDDSNAGVGSVLNLLFDSDEPMPAGVISDSMNVSTARVAVLLRKMAEKDLILRENDPGDARRTMVSLSDSGRTQATRTRDELSDYLEQVIDKVGLDRMNEFISISRDIKKALKEIEMPDTEENK